MTSRACEAEPERPPVFASQRDVGYGENGVLDWPLSKEARELDPVDIEANFLALSPLHDRLGMPLRDCNLL
jgi:hypothetical protein